MPMRAKHRFVVSMDVDSAKEDLFNEVYDAEHIPNLLKYVCAGRCGWRTVGHEHGRQRETARP